MGHKTKLSIIWGILILISMIGYAIFISKHNPFSAVGIDELLILISVIFIVVNLILKKCSQKSMVFLISFGSIWLYYVFNIASSTLIFNTMTIIIFSVLFNIVNDSLDNTCKRLRTPVFVFLIFSIFTTLSNIPAPLYIKQIYMFSAMVIYLVLGFYLATNRDATFKYPAFLFAIFPYITLVRTFGLDDNLSLSLYIAGLILFVVGLTEWRLVFKNIIFKRIFINMLVIIGFGYIIYLKSIFAYAIILFVALFLAIMWITNRNINKHNHQLDADSSDYKDNLIRLTVWLLAFGLYFFYIDQRVHLYYARMRDIELTKQVRKYTYYLNKDKYLFNNTYAIFDLKIIDGNILFRRFYVKDPHDLKCDDLISAVKRVGPKTTYFDIVVIPKEEFQNIKSDIDHYQINKEHIISKQMCKVK